MGSQEVGHKLVTEHAHTHSYTHTQEDVYSARVTPQCIFLTLRDYIYKCFTEKSVRSPQVSEWISF